MIREFYRALNFILLLFLAIVLCAVQSVVLRLPVLSWLELDCLLLLVVYIALSRNLVEGTVLVLLISRIMEIHSASPVGVLLISYLFVYLAVLFTKEMFLVTSTVSSILLAMGAGLVWKIVYLFMASEMGFFANVWKSSLVWLVPYLIGLGLCSRPVFALLGKLDTYTYQPRGTDAGLLGGEDY